MKIIDVHQIRELDKHTIEQEPITSTELMERAALACVQWITDRYETTIEFQLFCGLGNNGVDGLAIARLLAEKKYTVHVLVINYSEKRSPDFLFNYERLKLSTGNTIRMDEISSVESFKTIFQFNPQSVIIDAIIGAGLKDPAKGLVAHVIDFINQQPVPVISIDIPSGLYCDSLNNAKDHIVNAGFTLTFQFPKLSFMFAENAGHIGEFSILDIRLNAEYISKIPTKNYFITKNDVYSFLKKRNTIAHKGVFGHALIVAGSKGKMGAAVLAAKACMRSGVGLLTVHAPNCGYDILQTSLPEAMVSSDTEADHISDNIRIESYNAIGVGPGLGTEKQTQNVIKLLIQNTTVPLVLDADALNIISENKTWLAFIPANSILTPHPKEFERLAGKTENSMERLNMQREFSTKNNVYIVLKGAHTAISCPNGDVYFNSTGNPGMATGGSGDVLTGMITSLMAQGYTSQQSCLLGVYLHGLAGDFAAEERSEESMIASDIIEYLGEGFKFLKEQ